jgi:phosphatidylglycerophosphate synthase
MPAPVSILSTDGFLYNYLYDPLAKHLCFLDPNHITIACFLMLAPLIIGFLQRWPLWMIILIMFVRQSLDCLDGAVARACKKTSKTGAILDMSEDIVTIIALGGLALWIMWQKSYPIWMFSILFAIYIYLIYNMTFHLFQKMNDVQLDFTPFETFIHDNTMVLCIMIVVGLYRMIQ